MPQLELPSLPLSLMIEGHYKLFLLTFGLFLPTSPRYFLCIFLFIPFFFLSIYQNSNSKPNRTIARVKRASSPLVASCLTTWARSADGRVMHCDSCWVQAEWMETKSTQHITAGRLRSPSNPSRRKAVRTDAEFNAWIHTGPRYTLHAMQRTRSISTGRALNGKWYLFNASVQ